MRQAVYIHANVFHMTFILHPMYTFKCIFGPTLCWCAMKLTKTITNNKIDLLSHAHSDILIFTLNITER